MKTDHLMWKEDGWGYLPANKDVFHTFEWIRHHYKPTKILEIGFYAGHSTTYMAQIFKEAHITSCCPDHPRGRAYGEVVMNTFDNVTAATSHRHLRYTIDSRVRPLTLCSLTVIIHWHR